MNKILFVIIIYTLLFPIISYANRLPEQLAVPGGILKIPVAEISQPAPKVYFYKNRTLVTTNDTHWLALVGIPLSAKAGEHQITIKTRITGVRY